MTVTTDGIVKPSGAAVGSLGVEPTPAVYEQEYEFWPWGRLISWTADWIGEHAGPGTVVLDYMCGTGYLLNAIRERRSDLRLTGCSLTPEYLEYGRNKYPHVDLIHCDALEFQPIITPDIVLCTAGLHHLSPELRTPFLKKVHRELGPGKLFLIGEEVLAGAETEVERQHSVVRLWRGVLDYVVERCAPSAVVDAAITVFRNDLLSEGEYKLTITELQACLADEFIVEDIRWLWPGENTQYGDVLLICRSR
jgi:SAM-dependent methyltransferase